MDAQVFNTIFAEKYPDTLFVSSGGNTELDQRSQIAIAILGKVYSTVEILVLKDRDMASGQITTEQDRINYLENNPSNHRVLKRWEIENYLYDKEVLKAYCADKYLVFNEEDYDSFVTDVVNQELKDHYNRVRKICNIVGSVNQENFKKNLSSYIKNGSSIFIELENCVIIRA